MTPTLLDTNVVSELVRTRPEPRVLAFLESCDDPLISAIVFHELAFGIARLRDIGAKTRLELFLEGVKHSYRRSIVDIDIVIAETAGRLRAAAQRAGWALSQMDSLIAATALVKGATIATRNVKDFERLGIELVNPWMD